MCLLTFFLEGKARAKTECSNTWRVAAGVATAHDGVEDLFWGGEREDGIYRVFGRTRKRAWAARSRCLMFAMMVGGARGSTLSAHIDFVIITTMFI